MVTPYATVEDYEKRAKVTLADGPDRDQVEALLEDISILIYGQMPEGYAPDADVARAITVRVAMRAMSNPGGYRQRTIGDYSETLDEDGGLQLSPFEWDSLLAGARSSTAYTVEPRDDAFDCPDWRYTCR